MTGAHSESGMHLSADEKRLAADATTQEVSPNGPYARRCAPTPTHLK